MKSLLIVLLVCIVISVVLFSFKIEFSDIILSITAIIIFWYSWETYGLKMETKMNNKLQQSPFFVLIYDENNLYLKNEGKGVAYNVTIDSIKLGEEIFEFNILHKWYYCGVGEEKPLPISISKPDGSREMGVNLLKRFLYAIFQNQQNKIVEFNIRFHSQLKNDNCQNVVLKASNSPINIEEVEIYNYRN